jgi:hypothetical protein
MLDVVRSSRVFAAGANLLDRRLLEDYMVRCVGLEKYIARDPRRNQSSKQEHTHLVLQA